jgi:SAM-dependent methyltransferase
MSGRTRRGTGWGPPESIAAVHRTARSSGVATTEDCRRTSAPVIAKVQRALLRLERASGPAPLSREGARRPWRCRRRVRVTAMASGAEEFKAFEAAGWSRRASTYGRVSGAITARFVDPLLDAAASGRACGCSMSPPARARRRRGGRARGRARGRGHRRGNAGRGAARSPAARLPAGDAEALPFADACFDAVVGAFVLNHLPRPEVAAAELARVLASRRAARALGVGRARAHALHRAGPRRRRPGRRGPVRGAARRPDAFRFADDAQLRALLAMPAWRTWRSRRSRSAIAWRATRWRSGTGCWRQRAVGGGRRGAEPPARERARAAFAELVEPYRVAGGHELRGGGEAGLRAPAMSVADAPAGRAGVPGASARWGSAMPRTRARPQRARRARARRRAGCDRGPPRRRSSRGRAGSWSGPRRS